ncbi:uncharacterized protein P174DRAFT_450416 [Aspergillus novofumigatus IBT 16806]|uniref:Uncharacterized protein n=1 Tax=Aspergillus novofumigatus (strain IBT 16806) TaxID=1392255 RepID=A0A2I1CET1_ASPN1|nr:uncharacterized protein P174DRAFT_450416 [Aspergillus novofumigatus IBT 16806]PKX96108.1 hypothetical protein P174DRAFT_450416 [Aspergillus novofumigatus IBT 16806]
MVQSSMLPERLHSKGDDRRLNANEACENHWSSVFGSFLLGAFCTLEDKFTTHGFGILCKKVAQIAGLQTDSVG